VEDVNFGLTILFGVWIFFVTARTRRTEQTSSRPLELDTWSFDLELSNRSAASEREDDWVLG
jgi:hypothetical protein